MTLRVPGPRSAIEESEDQDVGKMQAKLNIVPIDQLPGFVGKKVRCTLHTIHIFVEWAQACL